jgi:hypothetical protein
MFSPKGSVLGIDVALNTYGHLFKRDDGATARAAMTNTREGKSH